MQDLNLLDAEELLHIAIEAANRNDHVYAISCLKAAVERDQSPEASAKVMFFLGAEYAQIAMYDRAVEAMQRAVNLDETLYIAQFQLGLLHLSSGHPVLAREAWAGLLTITDQSPEVYLRFFKQGLESLIDDDFANCRKYLQEGMALNQVNLALNGDMQKVLDALPAELELTEPEPSTAEEQHLFVSAYQRKDRH